jgi:hypothetical protein
LKGAERPRILWLPEHVSSAGPEAVELARMAGLVLDPWEEFVLVNALNERPDGKWAAFEVGLNAPRQNGKNAIVEARELAGLFLLGERLIVHSAHQLDTSLEALERLLFLIENNADFSRRVKKRHPPHARRRGHHAQERPADPLPHPHQGRRPRLLRRLPDPRRGDGDPRGRARRAAPDALRAAEPAGLVHGLGGRPDRPRQRRRLRPDPRARARRATTRRSPTSSSRSRSSSPTSPTRSQPTRRSGRRPTPASAIRITAEHIAREQRSMDPRTFAVERLGAGDWPATDDRPRS